VLALTTGARVTPADLQVGDCLFVRVVASQSDARPVGEPHDVAGALLAGGAERAGCDASHGHEVSAIVVPPVPSTAPGEVLPLLDHDQMEAATAPLCDAAFASYVGHALEGSRYVTFPVVPDTDGGAAWVADGRRTICVVARSDGQWMDHPAHASGE